MKEPFNLIKPALGLCLAFTSLAPLAPVSLAANNAQEYHFAQGRGASPGRRGGGGVRGECPDVQTPLTAIVPAEEVASQGLPVFYVGGVTTQERPVLWFYVPYTLNDNLTADFILQDESGTKIMQASSKEFAANQSSPGLVKVTLPALNSGKQYVWYFKVNCTAEAPIFTNGGIERISLDPSLASQLSGASPQQQSEIYQRNNLIYDAAGVLGQLYHDRPTDAAVLNAWNALLQSMGINDIPTAN